MKFFQSCLSALLLLAASSSVVMGEGKSHAVVEELSSSTARSVPGRRALSGDDDDEYLDDLYQVTVKSSSNCTTATGMLVVTVKDPETGLPIRRTPVSFFLTNKGNTPYTLDTKTNRNGVSRFTFEANVNDLGKSLWCSVAVKDPNAPSGGWQDIPCKMKVNACI